MNFINKLKKVFSAKAPEQQEENIINFCIKKIEERQASKKKAPSNLSDEEWQSILNQIIFAFKQKSLKTFPRSFAKRKIVNSKIKKGFSLFETYIKDI